MSTRTSIRLIVWIGVTLIVLSLAAIAILTYKQEQSTRASRVLVIETLKTLQSQEEFLSFMRDAESGQRGFLLTSDDTYLDPYRKGSTLALPKLAELASRASTQSARDSYLEIKRLSEFKLGELKQTITLHQEKGNDSALKVVKNNSGRNAMVKIISTMNRLKADEEYLLKSKTADLNQKATRLETLISLSSLTGLGAVLATAWWMISFLTAKGRAEELSRKSAIEARQTKNELSLVLSSTGEGIYQIDEKGNVLFLNKSAKKLLGFELEDVLGKPSHEVFHASKPDGTSNPAESCPLITVLKDRKEYVSAQTDWFTRKDGTYIPIRCTSVPLLSEAGDLMGAVVSFMNISEELKRAAQLDLQYSISQILAERGTKQATIKDVIATVCKKSGWDVGGFWQFDESTNSLILKTIYHDPTLDVIEFQNQSIQTIFKSGDGLPGRVIKSGQGAWISDIAADNNLPRLESAKQAGLKTAAAFPIVLSDTSLGVMEFFSCEPRERDDEMLATFVSIGQQIGQMLQRKAQEEQIVAGQEILKASQERYELAVRGSQDGIWDWNLVEHKIFVSSRCWELLKYPAMEATLTPAEWMGYVHPDDLKRVQTDVANHVKNRLPFESEYRMRSDNGEYYWFNSRGQAVWDAHGKAVRISGSLRDISERKEAEKRISEFYSTVSHELRTPLTSIRGSLGLIEGGKAGEVPPKVLRLVKIGRAESDRLIRIINDILDIKKIETGNFELNRQTCNPEQLVAKTIDGISGMAQENNVILESDIRTDKLVYGDFDRLLQVITNLLSNAIKYSKPDDIVTVRVEEKGSSALRFSIIDTGPGIPDSKRHKLFGMFQQLDSSDSRKTGGTGLGLAISKSIIQQHGGTIDVDSEVGKGSSFWFEIPSEQSAAVEPKEAKPVNVLVIERKQHWSEVLKEVFHGNDYQIIHAGDFEEANRELAKTRPEFIVFDLQSSQDGGASFLQQLKQNQATAGIAIIVLSGDDKVKGSAVLLDWINGHSDPTQVKQSLISALDKDMRCAKVLIVEDDSSTREVLRQQIGALGVKCLEAGDGVQALQMVRQENPDLIILDLGLPLLNGFEVVSALRDEEKLELPLLVYTNQDLSLDEKSRLSLGPSSHLVKARTTEEELLGCVRELLKGMPKP